MGPLPSISASLTGLPPVPAMVKSGAFWPTSRAAAGPATTRLSMAPASSIGRSRIEHSLREGSLLGDGPGGLLHERRVHDTLERDRALHKTILRPPLHLPFDVGHEQTAVAVLEGKAETDRFGPGLRVLRGDAHHLVVVGAGRRPPVLLAEDGVVVVTRGFDVALHEIHGALAVGGQLLGIEDGGHLPGVE